METGTIIFDPLLPWPSVLAGALLVALFVGLALWRGLSGWWLRGLAFAVLILALGQMVLAGLNTPQRPQIQRVQSWDRTWEIMRPVFSGVRLHSLPVQLHRSCPAQLLSASGLFRL